MKDSIKTTVDYDGIYKKPAFSRQILNRLLWFPLANFLPRGLGIWFFTNSCKDASLVRKYSTTHKAVEIMYNFEGFKLNGNGVFDSIFTYFWQTGLLNTRALRNRLKLVKMELYKIILEKEGQEKITILSLASGSASLVGWALPTNHYSAPMPSGKFTFSVLPQSCK